MSKINKEQISAKGFSIQIYTEDFKNDYISLTDIAKYKNTDDPRFVIQNWMRICEKICSAILVPSKRRL